MFSNFSSGLRIRMDSDKLMKIIVETEDTVRIRRASASKTKKDTEPFILNYFPTFLVDSNGFRWIQIIELKIIVETEDTARIRRASALKKDTDPFNTQLFHFSGGFKQVEMDSDKCLSDSIGGNVEPSRGSF